MLNTNVFTFFCFFFFCYTKFFKNFKGTFELLLRLNHHHQLDTVQVTKQTDKISTAHADSI